MKLKTTMILAGLALTALNSDAATRVFNLTGATAFRAATNTAIISLLGGQGTTQYAYVGGSVTGTNQAIFVGTLPQFPGDTIIVRTSTSGSTQGIASLVLNSNVNFLPTTTTVTTAGNGGQAAGTDAAKARFAFSDVSQDISNNPVPPLTGGGVGVVPFMFVAGKGAPATVRNMTDQLHELLWSVGSVRASVFTNNPVDDTKFALATGRNNGSGTRASILAETQYGPFRAVVQFGIDGITATPPTGAPYNVVQFASGGYSSNSFVRTTLTTNQASINGLGDNFFVSYLTISDAIAATGYIEATGLTSGGEGAFPMTYNGVRYSQGNINNGTYTLWGYQQLYQGLNPTSEENTFDTALRAAIAPILTPDIGLPEPALRVVRQGGDGGLIVPR